MGQYQENRIGLYAPSPMDSIPDAFADAYNRLVQEGGYTAADNTPELRAKLTQKAEELSGIRVTPRSYQSEGYEF